MESQADPQRVGSFYVCAGRDGFPQGDCLSIRTFQLELENGLVDAHVQEEAKRRLSALPREVASNEVNINTLLSYPSLMEAPFISKGQMLFVGRVGRGSFGEVFKGIMHNQDVAIKQLTVRNFVDELGEKADAISSADLDEQGNPRSIDQKYCNLGSVFGSLEKEVRILRKLCHKKIVLFLGICLDPPCVITEYCHLGSLYDLLMKAKNRPKLEKMLTWRMRIKLALDAATGMDYLHASYPAVLHRDLKTPNLLVDEHWNCKVADFNTSRFIDPNYVKSSISANNPRWLAPELLQGEEHTKASDVYPFGIVLWELMTWRTPWEAETTNHYQIVVHVLEHDMRPTIPAEDEDLPGDPCPFREQYVNLIRSCWHKEPDKRPTYSEIVSILSGMKAELEGKKQKLVYRTSTPDPPVTPTISSPSPFALASENRSAILSQSPFANGWPDATHQLPTKKHLQEGVVDVRAREINLPKNSPQAQQSAANPPTNVRHPACPPSLKQWSDPAEIPPTNAKHHMEHIRELFVNPPVPEDEDATAAWDKMSRQMLESMVPEFDCPPNRPLAPVDVQDRTSRTPKLKPSSRWRIVRDVFSTGASRKHAEHPGWQLIKNVLLGSREEEKQAEVENDSEEQGDDLQTKWNLLKQVFFSNDVPRSPAWDFIQQLVTSATSQKVLDSQDADAQTLGSANSASDKPAKDKILSPAQKRWKLLRDVMDIKVKEVAPTENHPGWRLLKEWLGDDSELVMRTSTLSGSESQNLMETSREMSRLPSTIRRYWGFLHHILVKNEGSLLVKHWDFLAGAIGNARDTSDGNKPTLQDLHGKPTADAKGSVLKSLASKRWKKIRDMLIVDYDPPSKEKWSFLREWLMVDTELGDVWNLLRDFARDRVEVPQGADWEIFRTLFFEDRGVRAHPHWAFLKDLLVKDAILESDLPDDSTNSEVEVSEGIRRFVLDKKADLPNKSKWNMVRTLFQVKDSALSGARETILAQTDPPEKSKWDEIVNLLLAGSSSRKLP